MNGKSKTAYILGVVLILLGITAILNRAGIIEIGWGHIWPIFILGPGLIFELSFFINPREDNAGLLVPGGVLLTIGLLFFYCTYAGFDKLAVLWPVFILAPAVGLFQLYLFGKKEIGVLIATGIISSVALVFLVVNYSNRAGGYIFPLILIIAGAAVIFKGLSSKSKE